MKAFGVTGTSSPVTDEQKKSAHSLLRRLAGFGYTTMLNGDCVGADEFLGTVWLELGGKLHLHPCNIPHMRARLKGDVIHKPLPPLVRNVNIVMASERLVALPKGFGEEIRSGTWHTVRQAFKAEKRVTFIWPDGRREDRRSK